MHYEYGPMHNVSGFSTTKDNDTEGVKYRPGNTIKV